MSDAPAAAPSTDILVVDDNRANLRLLTDVLTQQGYTVRIAPDGNLALASAQAKPPDLILLDIMMPEMDGYQVCARLKADERTRDIAVVFTSARDQVFDKVRAFSVGCVDYITKPLQIEEVLARVETHLTMRNLRKQLEAQNVQLQQEIVERVRAERELKAEREALRESEERFRTISELTSDFAYALRVEADGTLEREWATEAFARVTGFVFDKLEAFEDLLRIVHPDDVSTALQHVQELGSDQSSGASELRIVTKDGQVRWIHSHARSVWDERQGRVVRIYGAAQDITARKQAERALIETSRMEVAATLAGGIAHDFNNLMTSVLGSADMLKADLRHLDAAYLPDAAEMLATISESARQAGKLAQQMLAFARGGKYQTQVMDLNSAVYTVLHAQERALPSRIHIELDVAPDLRKVEADPTQMSQVVLNLLTNAVEAIEGRGSDTGRIGITTRNLVLEERTVADLDAGPYVYLSIQDTGCGMSEEVRSRAFEPFFTTKFQGRGMGLAAVYGIVKNHGGHIAVDSVEGQGATFEIYLPAVRVQVEEPPEPEGLVKTRGAARAALPITILIVEDDEIVRKLTEKVMWRLGYQTLIARDGQEAVEIARTFGQEIHLALVDIGLPVMGGVEAYPFLMEARPEMKVILYSGYELDATAQALLDTGASAFIQKPFQISTLEAEIRKALEE